MRAILVSLLLAACGLTCLSASDDVSELKYFVEVAVADLEDVRTLAAAGFDIAGVDRKAYLVGIVVTPDELPRLESFGWKVSIRTTNAEDREIEALSDYTDPIELSAYMDSIVASFPTLAKKVTLKDPLFEGQKQYAMLLTKDVNVPNDRPAFLMDAQHHAREVMTPEIAKDMIGYLTSRYATDPEVRHWLDSINVWIVGSVNPDGAMRVFTADTMWRKNRHPNCAVDNNRNYPAGWGSCNGSSASCTAETTRGTAGGSEPETQGLMQLTSDVRPYFALSYHSYGEYLMYPYGCNDPDEKATFEEVAQALNAILPNDQGVPGGYAVGPIWSTIYLADGGSIDTQYNRYGAYSFVIEVTASQFQPDYATWRNVTVQRQRTAWKFFLDQTLDGAQIRGTVTDVATGLPLPATVALQEVTFTHGEWPRTAGANGRYRVLVRKNSTNHLVVSHPGYCTAVTEIAVGNGPSVANVQLGQPAVPQGVAAVSAGDNAIDVSWQPAVNADAYHVYRALSSGGPYTLVATVPGGQTSYHDAPVSGGITWHYVVRAFQGCESQSSGEASTGTSGACTLGPAFEGVVTVANPASSTCALTVAWNPAAPRCGGAVSYDVYRGTSAGFTPQASNRVAAGLTGTTFTDHDGLSSGAPVYYVVRAVDLENNVDDGNLVRVSAAPTGPDVPGTWADDAGDAQASKLSGTSPWSVKPTGGKTGPLVYATGSYSNNACTALTTPPITLESGSVLSFASKYDLESDYDAVIVEIATGPDYLDWTKLAVAYPDDLVFGGNACGFPTSGAGTVFSRTVTTPVYPVSDYSASLGAYAGATVKIRWNLSSDGGVVGKGFWVDDVSLTNAMIPGACSPGNAPAPQEPTSMTASRSAGTSVDVRYGACCGATDNAIYWGTGPIAGSVAWTASACGLGNSGHAIFDPGDPAPDTFIYFVVVGQRSGAESSYGLGSGGERPEAAGVGSCDRPQVLGGTCP